VRFKVPNRKHIDARRVVELVKAGNTAEQIRRRLGASKSAVWRAIKNSAAQRESCR
jgi:DNA invertase Pin-like site-specific DNA recombinase